MTTPHTRSSILAVAKDALCDTGYAGLSTRRVADAAGVPLSQIHYHFGSKHNLVLAVLDEENAALLARQHRLYGAELPLWQQWEQACDFLDDDLDSGYVRVLQEMTAAGWSNDEVAAAVRRDLAGWFELLAATSAKVADRIGGLGPFTPEEIATLVAGAFLGLETMILLGFEEETVPSRSALRKVGHVLRTLEEHLVRARDPDVEGRVERDGLTLGYEVFGDQLAGARPAVLLLPTWTIVHARFWKMQVPYLARHFRVIVYDGPGNGLSGRTTDPARYTFDAYAADAAAVLDECGVERAVVVGVSLGVPYGLRLAGIRPDLVAGLVLVGGALALAKLPERASSDDHFLDPAPASPTGWDRYNLAYWHAHYGEFVEWFFEQVLSEPHSTKAREDAVSWAMTSGPEVLAAGERKPRSAVEGPSLLDGVTCPLLFVHGTDDRVQPHATSVRAAQLAGAQMVSFGGSGHLPNVRDPVRFNLLVRDFVDRVAR